MLRIEASITCDVCERVRVVYRPPLDTKHLVSRSAGDLRNVARHEGWQCSNGYDICPTCRAGTTVLTYDDDN
jgi:hypothetical protein